MDWLAATALGAIGGAVVEAVALFGFLAAWQRERHRIRHQNSLAKTKKRKKLPPITVFVDPHADILVALTRISLGAVTGYLFHKEIRADGMMAAVAVGAAAPALLRQVGRTAFMRPELQTEATTPTESGGQATTPQEVT